MESEVTFTYEDRLNYFHGLLSPLAKSRRITDKERQFVKSLCSLLQLEKDVCRETVANFKSNIFVMDMPPKFSDRKIAEAFIKDTISIGFADKNLHLFELNWLRFITEINDLDKQWCIIQLQKHLNSGKNDISDVSNLAVNEFIVSK